MSFTVDVKKLAEKRKISLGEAKQAIVFNLFAEVIKKTPVDTARAKNNWIISEGAPVIAVNKDSTKSPLGTVGPNGRSELSGITEAFGLDFLTNSLPYARLLEFGGYNHATDKTTSAGFSSQAPAGMIRVTVRELSAIAKKEGWK